MENPRPTGRIWKDRLEAWWSSRTHDAAYALGMAALLIYGSYGEAHPTSPEAYFTGGEHLPHTPAAAYLLVAAACLALAFRRQAPAAVLAVSTVAVAAYSLLGYVNGAALLAPMAALYALAVRVSWRRALAWGAGMLVVLMASTAAANPFGPFGGGFDVMPFTAAVACFAGIAVGNRRAYVASIRERAEARARRQIDEERLRIARELHDVVAHTMATINVQASAAAHVLTDRPDKAAESLAAIRAASKEGLRELRAILNVLRQADEADPTEPAPGLARLDALAAGVRRAGLPVTVTITGHARPLPPVADLAAYRILQEALTNTIRHAGPATAAVSLDYGESELRIEVSDTGRGTRGGGAGLPAADMPSADGEGSGHGLRGMAERAAAAGGTVETGPRGPGPSGGFRVLARLPLDSPRSAAPGPPAGRGPGAGKPEPAPGAGTPGPAAGAGLPTGSGPGAGAPEPAPDAESPPRAETARTPGGH